MATRMHIVGRVQGVGYRAGFARQAEQLGISGWVRNRHDGSVEALVDGDAQAMQSLLEWACKGPLAARVDHVQTRLEAQGVDKGFNIAPDA